MSTRDLSPTDRLRCGRESGQGKLAAGILLLCCPVAGHAAEWLFLPGIAVGAGYETNATLTPDPHDAVNEAVLTPELTIRRKTETSTLSTGFWARAANYFSSQVPDTREGEVFLSALGQTTERAKLGLDARSRWDTLLQQTAVGTGTGSVQDVDIGLVTTKVRRNWVEATPSVSYALTERGSVAFQYRFTNVNFADVGTTGLVDYQQHYLSGTYSYQVSSTNSLDVVIEGSRYRPAAGFDSNNASVLAGFSHAFSPTANAGIHAGTGRTFETMPDGSRVDTNTFALYGWATQQSELSTLSALIDQNVQPSGAGRSVSVSQMRAYWNRKLSETTAFRLRMKVFRVEALGQPDPLVDRSYREAGLGMLWYWAPELSFNVTYNYRKQKYDASPDSVLNNGVFVELAWAPPAPK